MFVGMYSENKKRFIVLFFIIVTTSYLVVLVHQRELHKLRVELLEVPGVPVGPGPLLARLLLGRPVFPWLP